MSRRTKQTRWAFAKWSPALLIPLAALLAAPWLIGPPCPSHVVIATGHRDGAYFAYAHRYREILARKGITLEVRATAGSVENCRLLETDDTVSLALVQGGTASNKPLGRVESLASLYVEPVWVFCRSKSPMDSLEQLRGKRIAIGPKGSGTRKIALQLLNDNKLVKNADHDATDFFDWDTAEAVKHLQAGEVDAAFLVISPDSPIVRKLMLTDGIQLMDFRRAAAYRQKYRYLSSVTIPEGLIDFQQNIPSRDIVLLAPAANLVARSNLHHALIPLLLQTVEDVHDTTGLLASSEPFPSPTYVDYPLNNDARRHFRAGPSMFYSYLPFWLAAWLDRVKLVLLPMCTLLIPLLKAAPPVYRWRIRSKIYRWYRVLREIDQKLKDAAPGTDFNHEIDTLRNLERELAEVSVPLSYMAEFYSLHVHISFVLHKLRDRDDETDRRDVRIAA